MGRNRGSLQTNKKEKVEMKKTNLLIDCNNICHIAKHTVGDLSYEEIPTGIVYGFLLKILTVVEEFSPARLFFFWDSRKSYRKDFWAGYKKKRKEELTKEDIQFFRQFSHLRKEVLPALGFRNIYLCKGYESDDLIHYFARNVIPNDIRTGMVTTDKDMFQTLFFAFMYNPITKRKFTSKWFYETYGFSANMWVDLKAIGGCSSDGIPGIKGVADPAHSEKSLAFKLLKGELKKGKVFDRFNSGKGVKIMRRNRKLIQLPFEGPTPIEIKVRRDRVTKKKLIDVFDEYGIKSFLGSKQLKRVARAFIPDKEN